MAAPIGNRFWEARTKHGRDKLFESPEVLLEACQEYFIWVEDNPLKEEKIFSYQGEQTREDVSKMRAMTISGLCIFLDIGRRTWDDYQTREDFMPVTTRVEEIIRSQKFSGAAADLLNPNIIARDLGLTDKRDITHDLGAKTLAELKEENDGIEDALEKLGQE